MTNIDNTQKMPVRNHAGSAKTFRRNQNIFLFCIFIYPVIHFTVFWLVLNISSIKLAFVNKQEIWNNFENFKWIIANFSAKDERINMVGALKNTLTWWFLGVTELFIAFVLTYFFYKKIRGYKTFRVILYLPAIISAVVMVGVFKNFVQVGGPLATIYGKLTGNKLPDLLTTSGNAMKTMIAYSFWNGYGVSIILFSGAFMRIPGEVLESARLDGVSAAREMTQIIVPMIWPTITTQIILSIAGMLGASGPVLLFTNGQFGTTTLNFIMFQQYYEFNQISRSAALGLSIAMVSIPLVFISRHLMNRKNSEVEY